MNVPVISNFLQRYALTFTKLELVENGSLTGGVETDHKNTHLLLSELQSF